MLQRPRERVESSISLVLISFSDLSDLPSGRGRDCLTGRDKEGDERLILVVFSDVSQ